MLTFPNANQALLEKFRDQIQNFIDPSGDTWKVMCVSNQVEAKSMPNVSYQSAVLCNQFNERLYEYREITNKLIQIGRRYTPLDREVTKVTNVFEDMIMLHSEDGLILERHMECYFGAIIRAMKAHPIWMRIVKEKRTETVYNYFAAYINMDKMHICNDTSCTSEEEHEKLFPGENALDVNIELKDEKVVPEKVDGFDNEVVYTDEHKTECKDDKCPCKEVK